MINKKIPLQDYSGDEVNLNLILKSLIREKILIIGIVLLSTIYSSIYAFTAKPIWRGSFNIVIKSDDNNSQRINNPFFDSFSINNSSSDNETQKVILKSESVLMPVFDYVKNYYTQKGLETENLFFETWVNKLDIEYEENTNVLTVKYPDEDKKLILDTLNLISKKYKDYSKRNVLKDIKTTINYLTTQREIMQKRSLDSLKEFNKFSVDNGLGNIDGFILTEQPNIGLNNNFSSRYNKPNINNLSSIKIQTPYNNQSKSAGQRYKEQFILLEKYEAEFSDLSSKLRPNTETLITLKEKINHIKSQLKKPNKILIEFKKLANIARRDEIFLSQIESNLESAKLEQVKTPKVWETISKPKIEQNKIFPKISIILIINFLGALFISSLIALLKEKLSGIVYSKESIVNKLNCDFIETVAQKETNYLNTFKRKYLEKNEKIGLINYKNFNNIDLLNKIKNNDPNIEIIDLYKFDQEDNFDKFIILIESEKYKFKDIEELNKYIKLYDEKILGWIFIEH